MCNQFHILHTVCTCQKKLPFPRNIFGCYIVCTRSIYSNCRLLSNKSLSPWANRLKWTRPFRCPIDCTLYVVVLHWIFDGTLQWKKKRKEKKVSRFITSFDNVCKIFDRSQLSKCKFIQINDVCTHAYVPYDVSTHLLPHCHSSHDLYANAYALVLTLSVSYEWPSLRRIVETYHEGKKTFEKNQTKLSFSTIRSITVAREEKGLVLLTKGLNQIVNLKHRANIPPLRRASHKSCISIVPYSLQLLRRGCTRGKWLNRRICCRQTRPVSTPESCPPTEWSTRTVVCR